MLDLFAGSGALAFEALSRGASAATLVESARGPLSLIRKNAESLGVRDRVQIVAEPVEKAWPRLRSLAPFDIVLADPPYQGGWELRLLRELLPWEEALRPGGVFCLEWGIQKSKVDELPETEGVLVKVREKSYGDSVLTSYQRPEL